MSRKTNNTSKVDYRLLDKKRIGDFLESLRGKNLTVKQIENTMEKLFKMGDQVIPTCISKLKDGDEELTPLLCYALQYADDFSIIDPLINILLTKGIPDETKTRILGVLADYGVDISQLPLDNILKDLDKMASNSMEKMLKDISEDIFFISYILDDFETFSKEIQLAYIKDLGETRDERAVLLLEVFARLSDLAIAGEAVRQLGRIKKPRALSSLKVLFGEFSDSGLGSIIDREIRKLRMLGVPETDADYSIKVEPYKTIVSSMDGLGSRAIWFSWRHPEKRMKLCTVNLLINVTEGIKDCWTIPEITVKDFNSTLMELKKGAEVIEDYEYAVDLVKDALKRNEEKAVPVPSSLAFWRMFFKKGDFTPKKYSVLLPEPYDITDEKYKETERGFPIDGYKLLDHPEFKDWFVAHPRVYDYAEEYLLIGEKYKNRKSYLIKLRKLNQEFIKELIVPEKEKLKRMLELTWDFLMRKGCREKADMVLKVLNNLDRIPLSENPFIQRITAESIRVALNNMKKGFDMRVNPDAFD